MKRILIPFAEVNMTVCPIAIAVGCSKCPAFTICPLKGVLGDHPKEEAPSKVKAPKSGAKRAGKGA